MGVGGGAAQCSPLRHCRGVMLKGATIRSRQQSTSNPCRSQRPPRARQQLLVRNFFTGIKSEARLAQRMHASGESASTIAATMGVSRATVYRVLAESAESSD
jgi:DNA invertase Pin-like site-specific DNA recombinase